VSDKIRLISTKGSVFTPMGRMPSQRKFTVVGIYSVGSDVESTQVLLNITDAGKLVRLAPSAAPQHRVFVHDPFSVNELESRDYFSAFTALDWQTARGELFQAVKMEKNMIGLLLFLIITVAVFNILSSLVMLVTEKETDVAIMKTLGMNRSTIVKIFVIQGAWTGILGAIAGGLLGITLAAYLNEFMSLIGLNLLSQASGGERLLPVLFDWSQITFIILGAIVLSLLATLYPAFRAANVKPAEALRYE
jgi:lipoprotein-releasing system permease protein